MKIVDKRLFKDELDILELDIVDFNRLNGYFPNPKAAVRTIASWFTDMATFTVVLIDDFLEAPNRNDFPGWDHIGNHEEIGKAYWNWFFWKNPTGKLTFSDSPDFQGEIPLDNDKVAFFYGDIGKVSASAFALTQKLMRVGDLWVSVLDGGHKQVIIESHFNINEYFADLLLVPGDPNIFERKYWDL